MTLQLNLNCFGPATPTGSRLRYSSRLVSTYWERTRISAEPSGTPKAAVAVQSLRCTEYGTSKSWRLMANFAQHSLTITADAGGASSLMAYSGFFFSERTIHLSAME